MNKQIFSSLTILFLLFIWGCEKDYNGVVDPVIVTNHPSDITAKETLFYGLEDSTITLTVKLDSKTNIAMVYCDIINPEGTALSPVVLLDNGNQANNDIFADDKVYSARFTFKRAFLNGKYTFRYNMTDVNSKTTLLSVSYLTYDNGTQNLPPVIEEITAPDTVLVTNSIVSFDLNARVSDPNGLSDITRVFFITYRPDGSTSGNQLDMYDDGELQHGDVSEGDGIYSLKIQVDPNNAKGAYRFEFQAQDRRKSVSEKSIHFIVIQ